MRSSKVQVLLISAILAFGASAFGDEYVGIAEMLSYRRQGSAFEFICISEADEQVYVRIDFYKGDVFRVRYSDSQIVPRDEYVVAERQWEAVELEVSRRPESISIETAPIKLVINKKPFRLAVYNKKGDVVLQESPAGMRRDKTKVLAFMQLDPNEHFFGFGAAAGIGGRGGFEEQYFNRLDKTGQKIDIGGRRVPFFISTKGYGIFLNSLHSYNSIFRMGCDRADTYSIETEDAQLDYYFFYGPRFYQVLFRYTEFTGRMPMIPKWGFGLRQAGYWDQKQVESCAAEYRKRHIPCDVIHIDSTWLDKGAKYEGKGIKPYKKDNRGYVDFEWDKRQFPDPAAMISRLAEQGFKFTLWETALVNPNVGKFYKDAAKKGYFVKDKAGRICLVSYGKRGQAAVPDFTNPKAAEWWKKAHKPLMDMGVRSFKLDHTGDLGTATEAVFYNGWNLEQMRILHRILNLKTVFEATAEYSGGRGMIWSSIAAAGTQKYPVTWCGDYRLTFEGLQEVIKSMQNMGLSGFGMYAPDIPAKRDIKDGHLYLRWAQFGLMNPACQSWTVRPWDFGPEVEASYRYYAKLRYRLLPYIYKYARDASITGVPICRAMVLEYQNDPKVYDKDLQYFIGKYLLVAPICTKWDERRIYLPAGQWFDYATGQRYQGPVTIKYNCPRRRIPIFVKAGAIIPMGPEMDYVGQKPFDTITVDIYPSGTSHFTLYEDDGKSYDYKRNHRFANVSFLCRHKTDGIIFSILPKVGGYGFGNKTYVLKVNNVTDAGGVTLTGRSIKRCASEDVFEDSEVGWWYDSSKRILWVKLGTVEAGKGAEILLKGSRPAG